MNLEKIIRMVYLLLCISGVSTVHAQSAYPVTLSSPMDLDTIVETEPNFVWQTDINGLLSDIRYSQRYVLCELLENQTKGEAIAVNTPLLTLEDYQSTVYTYNSSINPLQQGHTYVWQIGILFNGMQVDQSDVFQFTIYQPEDTLPLFYPVVFKNDAQFLSIQDGKIGLSTEETGELNLLVDLTLNGQINRQEYLNEYTDGTLQTSTTSPIGNKKRLFVLNIAALNLDAGNYSASWTAKTGKTYLFNFNVQ